MLRKFGAFAGLVVAATLSLAAGVAEVIKEVLR